MGGSCVILLGDIVRISVLLEYKILAHQFSCAACEAVRLVRDVELGVLKCKSGMIC